MPAGAATGGHTDELDYGGVAVRDDLRRAHRDLLDHVRAPGTWWTGAERVAIAAAARAAVRCGRCRASKASLSPRAVEGRHEGAGELPEHVTDTVHRVRTDPARLSKSWFDGVLGGGLDVARYVELIGVTTLVTGLDSFARAVGIPPFPLPDPLPGAPSRYRPMGAKPGTAWVPMIDLGEATGPESDLYGTAYVPNIIRALSLVPDEVRALRRASESHYVPVAQIVDPTARRALDRPQMELVAARVSALNECFY